MTSEYAAMPRILLVDDSSTMRRVFKMCLGSAYEYVEAEDGSEALERTAEPYPDLIIVDLHMPKMDGAEFLQELRAAGDPRMARIPVILLSGEADFPESVVAMADAVATKKNLKSDLKLLVEKHLRVDP